MADNPNLLIKKRLNNIENRIARLAFLHAHLNKFKKDKSKIDESSRAIEGASLFYYYSFSQFILEMDKLFSIDSEEYYSIPKLLNHIESNLRYVKWYKQKVTYPEITKEQYESGKAIWRSGERTEWYEAATREELNSIQSMICKLKKRIMDNYEVLEKIKLARDKVIAHLDKNFQNHDIKIQLEDVEKLLWLALELFNKLNLKINGSTMNLEHISSDAISTLEPITKYHKLKRRLIATKSNYEKNISVEELNEIIK